MGLDDIVKKTKDVVGGAVGTVKEKAPGIAANLKEDVRGIKDAAKSEGSLSDKAKAAVAAVRDNGGGSNASE